MFQYSFILFVFSVQVHKKEDNPQKTMEVNGLTPVLDSYDFDLIVIGGGSGGLAAAKVQGGKSHLNFLVSRWVTSSVSWIWI